LPSLTVKVAMNNLRVLPSVISSSLDLRVYAIGSVASAPDELIGVLPLRLLPKSLRRRFDARPFIHGRSMRYFPNTTTPLDAIDVAAADEFIKPAASVFPVVVRGDVRFDVCPVAVQIDRNVGQTVVRNFVQGPGDHNLLDEIAETGRAAIKHAVFNRRVRMKDRSKQRNVEAIAGPTVIKEQPGYRALVQ
jgi:hypothetical protein